MKKIIFSMMFVSASLFFTSNVKAQVNVNISIGNQPDWAPQDYDNAQYYYMPDMDVYYDVPARQFVYLNNNRWMRSANLPSAYGRYDLYRVHKVSINQRNAYMNHDRDKGEYAQFKGRFDQKPIRDSRQEKYSSKGNNRQNNDFKNENNKRKQEVAKRDSRYDDRNENYRNNRR